MAWQIRRGYNRLGFAVQHRPVRYLSTFLTDPGRPAAGAVVTGKADTHRYARKCNRPLRRQAPLARARKSRVERLHTNALNPSRLTPSVEFARPTGRHYSSDPMIRSHLALVHYIGGKLEQYT